MPNRIRTWINRDDGLLQVGNRDIGAVESLGYGLMAGSLLLFVILEVATVSALAGWSLVGIALVMAATGGWLAQRGIEARSRKGSWPYMVLGVPKIRCLEVSTV